MPEGADKGVPARQDKSSKPRPQADSTETAQRQKLPPKIKDTILILILFVFLCNTYEIRILS